MEFPSRFIRDINDLLFLMSDLSEYIKNLEERVQVVEDDFVIAKFEQENEELNDDIKLLEKEKYLLKEQVKELTQKLSQPKTKPCLKCGCQLREHDYETLCVNCMVEMDGNYE